MKAAWMERTRQALGNGHCRPGTPTQIIMTRSVQQ